MTGSNCACRIEKAKRARGVVFWNPANLVQFARTRTPLPFRLISKPSYEEEFHSFWQTLWLTTSVWTKKDVGVIYPQNSRVPKWMSTIITCA